MQKIDKRDLILNTAVRLFLLKGYRNTSMREIATESKVALGLITYYYENKFNLAKYFLDKQFQLIESLVNAQAPFDNNTLLYHASFLRFSNSYFMHPTRIHLYYELLEEGIYSSYIYNTFPRTLRKINEDFHANYSDDHVLLFGSYVPVELEKILVLQKRDGMFKKIQLEDISSIVFEHSVSRFIDDKKLIQSCIEESIEICNRISQQLRLD